MTTIECPSCKLPILSVNSVVQRGQDDLLSVAVGDQHFRVRASLQNGRVTASILHIASNDIFQIRAVRGIVDPKRVVWLSGCPMERLADPCLCNFAENVPASAESWTPSTISDLLAQVVQVFARGRSTVQENDEEYLVPPGFLPRSCRHSVILNGTLLVTLVADSSDPEKRPPTAENEPVIGLYNVVDLTNEEIQYAKIESIPSMAAEAFEVNAEEYALSLNDFYGMAEWTTCNCSTESRQLLTKKKWGHLIFLSHKWEERGVPGTLADLESMKKGVRSYVNLKLGELREKEDNHGGSATVKNIASEDDFGVWLDYPIVPNDPGHEDCEACKKTRRSYIAKMGSLPLISTTLALHPKETRSGWILHELTMNTHGNIHDIKLDEVELKFPSRVNLMAKKRVVFTNGSDGSALRCYEFVQLGQYPRCWPSVNRTLLHEWKKAGIRDERDVDARDILFKYARTFHHDCQQLKRFMVDLPQKLARSFIPSESDIQTDWVRVQAIPMQPNPDYSSGETESEEATGHSLAPTAPISAVDLLGILAAISQQTEDMEEMGIDVSISEASGILQLRQFVSCAMGLRAELLYGEGLHHWVHLSALTEELASAKRSVRLYDGEPTVKGASCTISLKASPDRVDIASLPVATEELLGRGVPEERLRYAFSFLKYELRPGVEDIGRYESGRTPAWRSMQEET
jgi:hypothetical protein